jgi:ribonuclease VapC
VRHAPARAAAFAELSGSPVEPAGESRVRLAPRPALIGLVVDASALLATLVAEPERDAVLVHLAEADPVLPSPCCHLEASIVAASRPGPAGQIELDQVASTVEAWWRFGKGRHPAGPNIIDCCSYGLAANAQMPLLAVGGYFAHADLDLVDLAL